MNEQLHAPSCPKCGGDMELCWHVAPSFIMSAYEVRSTGLYADCERCGYGMKVRALDEEDDAETH